MQILRHIPATLQAPCVLAIGNFDGIHLGHQALLEKLIQTAKQQGLSSAVMTFEPLFTPDNAPSRLCSLREKLEYFSNAGVERVYVCAFNRRFAKVSAEEFMQRILRQSLNAQAILVGEDFRFGAQRVGSTQDIVQAGFNLIKLPQVNLGNDRVSSTRVRTALANGQLEQAAMLLGRP